MHFLVRLWTLNSLHSDQFDQSPQISGTTKFTVEKLWQTQHKYQFSWILRKFCRLLVIKWDSYQCTGPSLTNSFLLAAHEPWYKWHFVVRLQFCIDAPVHFSSTPRQYILPLSEPKGMGVYCISPLPRNHQDRWNPRLDSSLLWSCIDNHRHIWLSSQSRVPMVSTGMLWQRNAITKNIRLIIGEGDEDLLCSRRNEMFSWMKWLSFW